MVVVSCPSGEVGRSGGRGAVLSNLRAACRGSNSQGQCGHGTTSDVVLPIAVAALSPAALSSMDDRHDTSTVAMAGGAEHSVVVLGNGRVYSWGGCSVAGAAGTAFVLGHGVPAQETMPRLVLSLASERVVGVACGSVHSLAWTGVYAG